MTTEELALKVVAERDELRHKLAGEAAHIKSLENLLVETTRERDEAIKQSRHAWDRHAEKDRAYGEALRERDELKARLMHAEADAEQAIHNEAFNERQRIAEWLRTSSRARGVLISIHSSQDLARCADAIERGEHER